MTQQFSNVIVQVLEEELGSRFDADVFQYPLTKMREFSGTPYSFIDILNSQSVLNTNRTFQFS